jgi:hypothetical protein
MTRRRQIRTVEAESVENPLRATAEEHVPEVEGLVAVRIEPDDLHRLQSGSAIEQQQHDIGSRLGKQGEIDAVWIDRRAKRMRGAVLNLEHWLHHTPAVGRPRERIPVVDVRTLFETCVCSCALPPPITTSLTSKAVCHIVITCSRAGTAFLPQSRPRLRFFGSLAILPMAGHRAHLEVRGIAVDDEYVLRTLR